MASKDEAHKIELKSRDETCAAALNIAEEAVSARQKLEAEWGSLRVKVEADVGNAKEMKFKEEKSNGKAMRRRLRPGTSRHWHRKIASCSLLLQSG